MSNPAGAWRGCVSSLLLETQQHILVPHYKGNLISPDAVQNVGLSLLWKRHLPGKIAPLCQFLYCLKRERGRRTKGMDLGDFKGFRNANIWRVQWTGKIGLSKTVLRK